MVASGFGAFFVVHSRAFERMMQGVPREIPTMKRITSKARAVVTGVVGLDGWGDDESCNALAEFPSEAIETCDDDFE